MSLLDFLIENNPCPVNKVRDEYSEYKTKLLEFADEGKITIAPAEGVLYTWVDPSILKHRRRTT